MKGVLVAYSGGLDSTVLLYDLKRRGRDVSAVSFHYGQRHARELHSAMGICASLKVSRRVVVLPHIGGSLLTDGKGSEVVPNRNALFLHTAAALAESAGVRTVAYAANRDDAKRFPDCRPAFVRSINASLLAAGLRVRVVAPFLRLRKWQVAALGLELGVPFDRTWSCYAKAATPCGSCLACTLRADALAKAHASRYRVR